MAMDPKRYNFTLAMHSRSCAQRLEVVVYKKGKTPSNRWTVDFYRVHDQTKTWLKRHIHSETVAKTHVYTPNKDMRKFLSTNKLWAKGTNLKRIQKAIEELK